MIISLITATLGRTKEIERLLVSLSNQTFHDFEIIIVDQNSHHEVEELVKRYSSLNIRYIRSNKKGLSYNRNIGLSHVRGDIIGFPDDDCFYESNLLARVVEEFGKGGNQCKLVAVQAKDISSDYIFVKCGRGPLTRNDFFKRCISINFFIRKETGMHFDELLGVGAEYGSGEETDFLWENVSADDECVFARDTFVRHSYNTSPIDSGRAYRYGMGMGATFKKEVLMRKHYKMACRYVGLLIRSFGGMMIKKEHRFYWETLKGRIVGFVKYPV